MLTAPEVRSVVETAIAAPSVHNTQPWLFDARPDRIDVLTDGRRALPHQDPEGRELLLSCAAASLHAELAIRGLGRRCDVELLPEPSRPDLVARLRVGTAVPPTDQELRLLTAVPYRHTDRSPFADVPLPVHVLDELGAAVEADGAWLQVLSTADMLELALWQAHAQEQVSADPAALAEKAAWARTEALPDDGVPAALVPGWPAGRPATRSVRAEAEAPSDVVLVLGSADDTRLSWVHAGRAMARLLLTATSAGLVAAPATLALELPAVRHGLARALALRGAPQMVLRTGYPAGLGTAGVGRRPVDEVLLPPAAAAREDATARGA
jgi:nitroreductase